MKRKVKPIPVKIVNDAPKDVPAPRGKYDKWQVEDALRNIERAAEVVSDKRMMREVKALAEDKRRKLDRISRLEKYKL